MSLERKGYDVEEVGDAFLDHFTKYFRDCWRREVFVSHATGATIQVLQYPNVFPDCLACVTLGLSRAGVESHSSVELVVVGDRGVDLLAKILANLAFLAVEHSVPLREGTLLRGIENICPEFSQAFRKTALLLTTPQGLPDEFAEVRDRRGDVAGRVIMAMLIDPAEAEFVSVRGPLELEKLFERKGVDPFDVSRVSAFAD